MSYVGIDQAWVSTGSSGGMAAVRVWSPLTDWSFYIQKDNSTITARLESAIESTGPWVSEGSTTTNSTAAELFVIRGSSPFRWVRPYIVHRTNTNAITFRLIGV